MTVRCAVAWVLWMLVALSAWSATPPPLEPPPLRIDRARGPIDVDGDLSDAGWREAARVDVWFETNVGENAEPPVSSVGWLAYDERHIYAAFEFLDPHPERIRAPLGDRDNLGQDTDFGGLILDPRHDGRTGVMFLVNPRGVQYDSVSDDSTGNEDAAPDFFWNSAARITERGWTLEIRVPFSSLRYPAAAADPRTWGVMLYRNWPREYRYQMFSTTMPRGASCFICRSNPLSGLRGLPVARSLVLAPYANGRHVSSPRAGLGTPLASGPVLGDVGLDVKWLPSADHALDGTLNPDFSQIEADVAQIAANERFALFFPEKRPFFLEGVELFSTPTQAVYTRTLTAPRWGLRGTGKVGATAYTGLVVRDDGGGSVILPGPAESGVAPQDFRSLAAVGRVRRDLGRSFVSLLATAREIEGDGGFNRVVGPDFQWRKGDGDVVTGQILWSDTRTPRRPDLAAEWDGRGLRGHAAELWWGHNRRHFGLYAQIKDSSAGFRADNGFVPQVGVRHGTLEGAWTFRPKGFLRRLRTFSIIERTDGHDGRPVFERVSLGAGMNGRFNSFLRLHAVSDRVRAGHEVLPRRQLLFRLEASPMRAVSQIVFIGAVGEEIDFVQARRGHGATLSWRATLRPSDHLELRFHGDRRWLDLDLPDARGRLFGARVDRLRVTYTFTSRAFLRAVGQYVETRLEPALHADAVAPKSGGFFGSLLFAYKLNWQTLVFVGWGDERELDDAGRLRPAARQVFVKLAYALQS